jgi:hypothetical protein
MLKHLIGAETCHSYGDLIFNVPLIKALSEKYNTQIHIAMNTKYKDAYNNIPWIGNIYHINNMGEGPTILAKHGIHTCYQLTQNIKFHEYRASDPNHSLAETPTRVGREIGVEIEPKPIFIPSNDELEIRNQFDRNTVAIESEYRSGQSWTNISTFNKILDKFRDRQIIWMSNSNYPNRPNINIMAGYTRRQVVLAASACDTFISVGSGLFCSTIGLPRELQPRNIVCLMNDYYKYKGIVDNKTIKPVRSVA